MVGPGGCRVARAQLTEALSFICGLVVGLLLRAACAGDVPARIGHNCRKGIELYAERIRLAQVAPLYRLKWRRVQSGASATLLIASLLNDPIKSVEHRRLELGGIGGSLRMRVATKRARRSPLRATSTGPPAWNWLDSFFRADAKTFCCEMNAPQS